MRINNNRSHTTPGQSLALPGTPGPVIRTEAPITQEATPHSASSELLSLSAQVHELPEIRPERLDEVSPLLAAGHYLTPPAATQTADAILQN